MEHYWRQISNIHLLTKHYLLIAEEIDERAFIQPLKEHRDAYDHIIRIYGIDFTEKKAANLKQYKESNMKKALGHEYRAFFDTAASLLSKVPQTQAPTAQSSSLHRATVR